MTIRSRTPHQVLRWSVWTGICLSTTWGGCATTSSADRDDDPNATTSYLVGPKTTVECTVAWPEPAPNEPPEESLRDCFRQAVEQAVPVATGDRALSAALEAWLPSYISVFHLVSSEESDKRLRVRVDLRVDRDKLRADIDRFRAVSRAKGWLTAALCEPEDVDSGALATTIHEQWSPWGVRFVDCPDTVGASTPEVSSDVLVRYQAGTRPQIRVIRQELGVVSANATLPLSGDVSERLRDDPGELTRVVLRDLIDERTGN